MPPNVIGVYAFSSRVLAVAVQGGIGDWCAYIDAVPGKDHKEEFEEVARKGEKLPQAVANVIFPHVASSLKWRD